MEVVVWKMFLGDGILSATVTWGSIQKWRYVSKAGTERNRQISTAQMVYA
jgi:hypothetical protein